MGEQRWFCRSTEEWTALAERLKQMPCPHCKVVGTLVRHGCLSGYDDSKPQHKTIRRPAAVTLLERWLNQYLAQQAKKKSPPTTPVS